MTLSEYLLRFPLSAAARVLFVGVAVFLASLVGYAPAAEAETRSLKLYNNHTGERATITFKRNGRYIQSGLRDLNQFLRDWRRNEATKMDPHLFDLVWEVYQKSGSSDYIHVVSGYRSPATNNMLRKRSRGVAKKSQHMLGKAMDFFIPDANLAKLRAAGLRMQVGGVGYYPTSGSPFVHMDTGSVRHWPRMTRAQLARVFPNGRTIHIPSDGKPMPGYKQALAELKARRSGGTTRVASNDSGSRSGNTRGQVLTNVTANPAIRPTPVGANAGRGTSGKTLIASLFGRGGPKPPAEVKAEAASDPQPSRAARRSNDPLPGVDTAEVTPPTKPGYEPDADAVEDAADELPASGETAEPILVAALPLSKPRIERSAPVDAIDAIDAVVASGGVMPQARPQGATLAAYAPDSDPAPVLRPRPSVTAGNQLAPGSSPEASNADAPSAGRREAARAQLARAGAGNGAQVAARVEAALADARDKARMPVLSGRIPAATDPFARFTALPAANEPRMLSGDQSTRTSAFADLRHPDQRKLAALFDRPARLFNAGFDHRIYGSLRTDRFDGPAVVALSLVATD